MAVLDASEGLKVWIELESRKFILEFDVRPNRFDVWEICSEDIMMIVSVVWG